MANQTTTLSAFAPGAAAAAAAAAAGGPVGTGTAVGGGAGATLQPYVLLDSLPFVLFFGCLFAIVVSYVGRRLTCHMYWTWPL